MMVWSMNNRSPRRAMVATAACLFITGCENFPTDFGTGLTQDEPLLSGGTTLKFEERDVEAPEVFDVTDQAVWDGRPSFGGVWAAYPTSTQPERVIMTNKDNGKTVVGALFKSEKENPGPKIKLSSDAAKELGVVPGTPTNVSIVAIRSQPVQLEVETAPAPEPIEAEAIEEATLEVAAPEPVETEILTETIAEAIEAAPKPRPVETVAGPAVAAAAAPAAASPASDVPSKPFIQVATLSSAANALTLETKLGDAGISYLTRVSKTSTGKELFRVLAGPATTQDALRALSQQVSDLGFSDAFPVTN